ncbi:MAG TPA: OsmC family protein [Caulobacteraceae bacterium]
MSAHKASVRWGLDVDADAFVGRRYSRMHTLMFGDGLEVPGSPSPAVVPAPWSSEQAIDPESAFVAALAACHMLWFLDHAARAGVVVTAYEDAAEGTLGRLERGKFAMTRVVLHPKVEFAGGRQPTSEEIEALHEKAHADCFIANSVTCEVVVEG